MTRVSDPALLNASIVSSAAAPPRGRAVAVLIVATLAFAVSFASWMMMGVTGIPIREALGLSAAEFGVLVATPLLTGAVLRLPFGIWTDRLGGRRVMTTLLAGCAVPLWLSSYATQYWHFLMSGLVLGTVGASFSVGTPYVARFFPDNRGFAMGIFGAGVSGAAINMFVAPHLVTHFGWQSVPRTYSLALLAMALVFRLVALPDPARAIEPSSIRTQLAVLRDPRVWKYCQYYSIVFGGFTALSIWMPQYFLNRYHLPIEQAALLAACFSLPGGVLRAMGGWLSDRFGAQDVTWWVLWAAWICLFLLSYPPMDITIQTLRGPLSFHMSLPMWAFAGLLFLLGVSFACGMASTFKYIGDDFPTEMGAVAGVVGMVGALGGFLLPILFGLLADLTAIPSSCFMLLYGIVWVSLILIYITEIRRTSIFHAEARTA